MHVWMKGLPNRNAPHWALNLKPPLHPVDTCLSVHQSLAHLEQFIIF